MNGFYLGALVIAFVLVIMLSNVGKGILNNWETPASNGASVVTSPVVTPSITTRQVAAPASGQPVAVMPVPANPAPLTGGNPPNPPANPANAARGDEQPPAPRSY